MIYTGLFGNASEMPGRAYALGKRMCLALGAPSNTLLAVFCAEEDLPTEKDRRPGHWQSSHAGMLTMDDVCTTLLAVNLFSVSFVNLQNVAERR